MKVARWLRMRDVKTVTPSGRHVGCVPFMYVRDDHLLRVTEEKLSRLLSSGIILQCGEHLRSYRTQRVWRVQVSSAYRGSHGGAAQRLTSGLFEAWRGR
ncbi:hypothetical protein MRX96_059520 [Rhipicephalus microplus]